MFLLSAIATASCYVTINRMPKHFAVKLSSIRTFVTENAHLIIAFKIYMNMLFQPVALYWFDVAVILLLWRLFLQGHFDFQAMYEATRVLRSHSSSFPPRLFSVAYCLKFLNPLWLENPWQKQTKIAYSRIDDSLTLTVLEPKIRPENANVMVVNFNIAILTSWCSG
jgi:hypothetical protein